jgi:hypothetical protein
MPALAARSVLTAGPPRADRRRRQLVYGGVGHKASTAGPGYAKGPGALPQSRAIVSDWRRSQDLNLGSWLCEPPPSQLGHSAIATRLHAFSTRTACKASPSQTTLTRFLRVGDRHARRHHPPALHRCAAQSLAVAEGPVHLMRRSSPGVDARSRHVERRPRGSNVRSAAVPGHDRRRSDAACRKVDGSTTERMWRRKHE